MAVNVVIEDSLIQADPGGEVGMRFRVTNLSNVVDTYRISVLGDAAAFATAQPGEIPLFPGAEGQGTLVFRPPVGTRLAGGIPVGVMVTSSLDGGDAVVEEGVLELAGAAQLASNLRPRRVEARKKSKHHVTVENTGNVPVHVTLQAADPDDLLRFKLKPQTMTLEPDQVGHAKLKVKAYTGSTGALRQFSVSVIQEGAAPQTLDGALFQRGGKPAWLVPACMALIALTVLGFVLYNNGNKSAATATRISADEEESTTTLAAGATTVVAGADGAATTAPAAGPAAGPAGGGGAAAGGGAAPGGPAAPGGAATTKAQPIAPRPGGGAIVGVGPSTCTLPSPPPTDAQGRANYAVCAWALNRRSAADGPNGVACEAQSLNVLFSRPYAAPYPAPSGRNDSGGYVYKQNGAPALTLNLATEGTCKDKVTSVSRP